MIPVMCRVGHYPERGQYGDCVRACVASIMEMDAEAVPHFFEDNCDGATGNARIVGWLAQFKLAPFYATYDGSASLADVLQIMGEQNGAACYILHGANADGDHVVVCRGGKVLHDPNWYPSPLSRCGSSGYWSVMVIARS